MSIHTIHDWWELEYVRCVCVCVYTVCVCTVCVCVCVCVYTVCVCVWEEGPGATYVCCLYWMQTIYMLFCMWSCTHWSPPQSLLALLVAVYSRSSKQTAVIHSALGCWMPGLETRNGNSFIPKGTLPTQRLMNIHCLLLTHAYKLHILPGYTGSKYKLLECVCVCRVPIWPILFPCRAEVKTLPGGKEEEKKPPLPKPASIIKLVRPIRWWCVVWWCVALWVMVD